MHEIFLPFPFHSKFLNFPNNTYGYDNLSKKYIYKKERVEIAFPYTAEGEKN